jgi:hypothetical protein
MHQLQSTEYVRDAAHSERAGLPMRGSPVCSLLAIAFPIIRAVANTRARITHGGGCLPLDPGGSCSLLFGK